MNQQQRLPRCPKGMHRNKSSGLCEHKSPTRKSPTRQSPTRQSPIRKSPTMTVNQKRCPKGMHRNKISGLCEHKSLVKRKSISPSRQSPIRKSPTMTVNQKRCPKGMYRNKISGLCEQKSLVKRKSVSPSRQSPVKRKSPKKRKKKIQKKFITPIKSILTSPTNSSFMLRNRKGIHDENLLLTKKILKFYKNDATPTRVGGTDIHTGEIKFLQIALRYLKQNYDNFSYFKSPFDKRIDMISFFVFKVGALKSDKILVTVAESKKIIFVFEKTERGYEILPNEKNTSNNFAILDIVVERIKRSLRKKRFFVISITLQSVHRKMAHANILIYDSLKNELELFDPHGYNTAEHYDPKNVRFLIEYMFQKISPGAHFLNSFEMNPLYGLQSVQTYESEQVENEIGGYCGAWALFYLHMRLANPDVPQITLIQNIKQEIIDKGNFTNFIRNYAKYITNEGGYRRKFDIKPRNIMF